MVLVLVQVSSDGNMSSGGDWRSKRENPTFGKYSA